MSAKQTQIQAVQAALLARQPVDQVEAIRRGWGLRLGALIYRLRGRGWPILTERDHNNGLARYRLPEGWQPPAALPAKGQAKDLARPAPVADGGHEKPRKTPTAFQGFVNLNARLTGRDSTPAPRKKQ